MVYLRNCCKTSLSSNSWRRTRLNDGRLTDLRIFPPGCDDLTVNQEKARASAHQPGDRLQQFHLQFSTRIISDPARLSTPKKVSQTFSKPGQRSITKISKMS